MLKASTGILMLTAVTAGLIDVLSFAKLGGIFTSAMTGNLALLGFYTATGAVHSAIRALSALGGFITGCVAGALLGRGKRTSRSTVRSLLGLETLMIMVCALGSMQPPLAARAGFIEVEILLLGFAMGLQSIVGNRLKQTNVVFTTTLMKIVTAAFGPKGGEGNATEIKREAAVVAAYLAGALIAGITIASRFEGALFIPVIALGIAFFATREWGRGAAR
jgi:uncharacterized membrane protein YoaK (UPF0700 family)